jgi:hypothetical protein
MDIKKNCLSLSSVMTSSKIKSSLSNQRSSTIKKANSFKTKTPTTSSKSSPLSSSHLQQQPVNTNSVMTRKRSGRVKTRVTVPPIPIAVPAATAKDNLLSSRLVFSDPVSHDFNSDFLAHLNENASRIQAWYRHCKQASKASITELIKLHQQKLSTNTPLLKYSSKRTSNISKRGVVMADGSIDKLDIGVDDECSNTLLDTIPAHLPETGDNNEAPIIHSPEPDSRIDQIKRRREEMARSAREVKYIMAFNLSAKNISFLFKH